MPNADDMRLGPEVDAFTPERMLGMRLRRERKARGLSLANLAQMTGISVAGLSQIERGASSPSVRTLSSIVGAMGLTLIDVFTDDEPPPPAAFVVRQQDRRQLPFWREGMQKELLTDIDDIDIEMLLITIEPGATTGRPYSHGGEEAGLVIEGQLSLSVDDQTVLLRAGDAFGFRSERRHAFGNPGPDLCRVVFIGNNFHKPV